MNSLAASALIGYLLGSIPFGYLLVRGFRGTDIRSSGSGNIGATNVARTSPALGVATLLLDALKGLAAVMIVFRLFPQSPIAPFVAAFAAVCGHVAPVWLKFRGGKGVATGLGSFLLLTPKSLLLAITIFLALAAIFRFVSLASILAAASLPLLVILLKETPLLSETELVSAASLLIIVKHHRNLGRLLAGTEPRFEISRRK